MLAQEPGARDEPGLALRPANATCFAPARVPEIGSEGLPPRLSETGCFAREDPRRPLAALIPFDVNVPLWSDGAAKERWLALPDGARIHVGPNGDFDLPPGSVTIKTFKIDNRPIETRFFVRLLSGEWSGYTYEWNEAGTDASILNEGSRRRPIGGGAWHYPTRAECNQCHTQAAGRSLGLEIVQLNRELSYPGGRTANQLTTWQHIGLFESPLSADPARLPALPRPAAGGASLDSRARGYLHANCANCHRPGVELTGRTDFRFDTALAATMTCDAEPRDILSASADARIIAPGSPERSMIVVRMLELGRGRMPEIGSLVVDREGVSLLSDWIHALTACP
jgi:uncharacterized repeat protein (TIGR03806 family)